MNNMGSLTGTSNQINERFTIIANSQITPSLIRSMTESSIGNTTIY